MTPQHGALSAHEVSKSATRSPDVTRYHRLKEAGLCVSCGKPRGNGAKARCKKCNKRHTHRSELSRARKQERGLHGEWTRADGESLADSGSARIAREVDAGLRCRRCFLSLAPGQPCIGCPDSIDVFATSRRDTGDAALPRRGR